MTGGRSLESLVEADPASLRTREERLRRQLDSDDVHERLDGGRALRAAAKHDGGLVATHAETLVGLLGADHGSLRLSGAVGLAALAADDPGRVAAAVPELTATLETERAPAIQLAILRTLTRVGERSPAAVAVADEPVAARMDGATRPIRTAVATVFAGAVVADPARFPETVRAYERAVAADSDRVRRVAALAVAAVAAADPTALESPERALDRVEALRAEVRGAPRDAEDEELDRAAETLRAVVSERS